MTIEEFKLRLKEKGMYAIKKRNLEALDIHSNSLGVVYKPVYYAEIHHVTNIDEFLKEKRSL